MPDMYAFQAGAQPTDQTDKTSVPQFTPNILPCQIHHDGPIESTDRFWTPASDAQDGTQTAHFRGRKLRGRRVAIPEGFEGVVAVPTERIMQVPQENKPDSGVDSDVVEIQPEEPVKVLEMQGKFDGMIVWGHEALPAADDTFVKGVEEWMRFAETMHGTSIEATNGSKE